MNRIDKFIEKYEELKELVMLVHEELEECAENMEFAEQQGENVISSISFNIPERVFNELKWHKKNIDKSLNCLIKQTEKYDEFYKLEGYFDDIKKALEKLEENKCNDFDDCSEVYDLAYDIENPFDELDKEMKKLKKVKK